MIDIELTQKIKDWLDTDPAKRDLTLGAQLLLRVTRNKILYANVSRRLDKKADVIEYHLQKAYNARLRQFTHEEVDRMMQQAGVIAKTRGLDFPESSDARSDFQRGKRADHDELPAEIQQLYTENADIRRRMRECHTRLRMINSTNSSCPDSDRYPFVKELIALDQRYRDNWNKYDHYIKGSSPYTVEPAADERTISANAARTCNLLLGKYAKQPDDNLAERIRGLYAKVQTPTNRLTEKMTALGLLE